MLIIFAAVLAQQVRHVLVLLDRSQMQRGLAFFVLGIDIGFIVQQQRHNIFAALSRRLVQRRLALFILGVDVRAVGQE